MENRCEQGSSMSCVCVLTIKPLEPHISSATAINCIRYVAMATVINLWQRIFFMSSWVVCAESNQRERVCVCACVTVKTPSSSESTESLQAPVDQSEISLRVGSCLYRWHQCFVLRSSRGVLFGTGALCSIFENTASRETAITFLLQSC